MSGARNRTVVVAIAAAVLCAAAAAALMLTGRADDTEEGALPPAAGEVTPLPLRLAFDGAGRGGIVDRDGEVTGFTGTGSVKGGSGATADRDVAAGALTIRAPEGSAGAARRDGAAWVRYDGRAPHAVTATLQGPLVFDLDGQYGGVFTTGTDAASLTIEGADRELRAVLTRQTGGEITEVEWPLPPLDGSVTLRMVVDPPRGIVTAHYGPEGGPLTVLGSAALLAPPAAGSRAGVVTGSTDGVPPVQVAYTDFSVLPLAVSAAGWSPRAAAPVPRYESQGGVAGGRLFVFGGFVDINVRATTRSDVYDPAGDRWSRVADMPEPITHAGAAVAGREIWIAGGFVGDNPGPSTDHVWRYDTERDRWSPGPDLPAARAGGALVRLGNRLHYFGGTTREAGHVIHVDHGDHWVLDLRRPTRWTPAAPMPDPRNHMAGVALGGLAYAIGGQHEADEVDGNRTTVVSYDPATDRWTERAPLPQPIGHISASTVTADGRILVAAGLTQKQVEVSSILAYDARADSWEALRPLPEGLQSPLAGVADGRLLVTGGSVEFLPGTATYTATLADLAPAPTLRFGRRRTLLQGPDVGARRPWQPTSLARGPDNRLYVAQLGGEIHVLRLRGTATPVLERTITTIARRPNRDSDGRPSTTRGRQVTGVAVASDTDAPGGTVLYVTHSDPRFVADGKPGRVPSDPASGVVTMLRGPRFDATDGRDLVRGLPRSAEFHSPNGLALGPDGWLYLTVGANTNHGAPSTYFSHYPETTFSAAVIRLRPDRIARPIDVSASSRIRWRSPCAADEDVGDGCEAGADVTTHPADVPGTLETFATGVRNGYDLVWHSNGRLYVNDNGGNAYYGTAPGPADGCPDATAHDPATTPDRLLLVRRGSYLGHPDPARGECRFGAPPGRGPLALYGMRTSTDGIIEYRGNAFGGRLRGQLLSVNYGEGPSVVRVALSPDGTRAATPAPLARGLSDPVDLVEGPGGRLIVAEHGRGGRVSVLSPVP
ncbi:kelch repeat-containing protein [Miltoncostaea oceani]|uniref:kelch repeat-containing protein n=1 Tax=Miltoncostaea oceani TaxID=2843216 RepID=UPI001C3C864E|nr:kelch repeat-containing protein [Miltoncostaea oceani]